VTYFYRAYGLTLASDTLVPGLCQERTDAKPFDLELTVGPEPDWIREVARLPFRFEHPRSGASEEHDSVNLTALGAGDFYQLQYGDGTRFVMDGEAKRLWGTCQPPLTLEDFATYLSGPVLGFVLRRRGVIALHASALCIEGNAVILCGESESGKSTTLAALALRKFAVLTEDISPIKEESGTLYVEPGYPRICLWPDAVEKVFGASEALPRLTPTWEKHFLPLDGVQGTFESQPQPLGAVYLLSPRTDEVQAPYIEELSKRDALLLLVQNTYMSWVLNRGQRAAELDVLTKVVERVPVRRIFPHVGPVRIGALCDLIAEDARGLFRAQASAAKTSYG
jgi:hypothetical protein